MDDCAFDSKYSCINVPTRNLYVRGPTFIALILSNDKVMGSRVPTQNGLGIRALFHQSMLTAYFRILTGLLQLITFLLRFYLILEHHDNCVVDVILYECRPILIKCTHWPIKL